MGVGGVCGCVCVCVCCGTWQGCGSSNKGPKPRNPSSSNNLSSMTHNTLPAYNPPGAPRYQRPMRTGTSSATGCRATLQDSTRARSRPRPTRHTCRCAATRPMQCHSSAAPPNTVTRTLRSRAGGGRVDFVFLAARTRSPMWAVGTRGEPRTTSSEVPFRLTLWHRPVFAFVFFGPLCSWCVRRPTRSCG